MDAGWAEFFVTTGGAAAALTGLLFVAVALRPREIRNSTLMVGRARSAFYAFVTVLFVALCAGRHVVAPDRAGRDRSRRRSLRALEPVHVASVASAHSEPGPRRGVPRRSGHGRHRWGGTRRPRRRSGQRPAPRHRGAAAPRDRAQQLVAAGHLAR